MKGPPLFRAIPVWPHCNSSARIEYLGMRVPDGRAFAGHADYQGPDDRGIPLNSPNTAGAKSLTLRHGCDMLGGTGSGPRQISVR